LNYKFNHHFGSEGWSDRLKLNTVKFPGKTVVMADGFPDFYQFDAAAYDIHIHPEMIYSAALTLLDPRHSDRVNMSYLDGHASGAPIKSTRVAWTALWEPWLL
jgi:prepilin-type processing-associated H-X9-DG protein